MVAFYYIYRFIDRGEKYTAFKFSKHCDVWTHITNFAPLPAPTKLLVRGVPPKTPNIIFKGYYNMNSNNNSKNLILKFRVNKEEKELIELRASKTNHSSLSSYLRKIALTGIIVNYENEEIKKLNRSLIGIQTNINQIAIRVNSTNRFYDEDIQYIKEEMNEIWQSLKSIQSNLQSITQ